VLLSPPLGRASLVDATLFGLPVTVLYAFGVWGLLVAGAYLLADALSAGDSALDSARDGTRDRADG